MTTVSNAACIIWKRVDPKSSHHKEKNFITIGGYGY